MYICTAHILADTLWQYSLYVKTHSAHTSAYQNRYFRNDMFLRGEHPGTYVIRKSCVESQQSSYLVLIISYFRICETKTNIVCFFVG